MIGLVFAGQGSEIPFMGKDFYDEFEEVRELYKYAEEQTKLALREVAFSENDRRLHETLYAQVLLFLFDVFVIDQLRKKEILIDVTFGLSLGEYGALYASGVVNHKIGLRLIQKRAELMSEVCDERQGMAAILGLDVEALMPLLDQENVFLANYNTPQQLVISGLKQDIKKVCEKALNVGAKRAIMLPSSGAFHTPFMKAAAKEYGQFLAEVEIKKPTIPLLLNTTGKVLEGNLKKEMEKQIDSSVYFYQSIEEAISLGVDTFIEVAPKSVVKSMIKKVDRKVNVFTISSVRDLHEVVELDLGGYNG